MPLSTARSVGAPPRGVPFVQKIIFVSDKDILDSGGNSSTISKKNTENQYTIDALG